MGFKDIEKRARDYAEKMSESRKKEQEHSELIAAEDQDKTE
ncbi:hypothetical protein [Desulfoscipio geothermicus]|uniref:Uncharacterized protein n=1 Tax=Desulfoscipio geothermicus DSM 3669 TaxID=1121426 RepID=A0A1I6DJ03_9FIRM|nr:hypothetical protein [Desulfoscipio geothermicus]SFR05443.1 hypothetical protein SAMN05660706_11223 [Desulfoscipio geothermicus DSM 3669]